MSINSNGKREITDINGATKNIACFGCAIQKGKVTSPGGSIAESQYFYAHQDYEIPIPGFIILASKRHLQSVAEFTDAEQGDSIQFLCRLRKAMKEALSISVVYLVQEEDTSHHFHTWMFPRYPWMQEQFGRKVQSIRPIMEYAREHMKTEDNLKEVSNATQKLKQYFLSAD